MVMSQDVSVLDDARGDRTPGGADARVAQPLRARRLWPGSRALLGGLLVALAFLGTFVALRAADRPAPLVPYVVAAVDIAPGSVVDADDIGVVEMDLPTVVADRAFVSPDELVGSVATARLARGDLVTTTDVAPAEDAVAPLVQSFALERARAVGGDLRPGDRVDVAATFTAVDGVERTEVVVADVVVHDVSGVELGSEVIVAVALPDRPASLALAHAVDTATLTLVRTAA